MCNAIRGGVNRSQLGLSIRLFILLYQVPCDFSQGSHHLAILVRLKTTSLPEGIPCGNALHDNGIAIHAKGMTPGEKRAGIPTGNFGIPVNELCFGGQTGRGTRLEACIGAADRVGLVGRGCDKGTQQIVEIGQRVSDGAHFPVQDANDTRLGLVKDDIVNFVIAVDKGGAVLWLGSGVLEEGDHVVLVGKLADRVARVFVFG